MSSQLVLGSRATGDAGSAQVIWHDVDLSDPQERDWLLHQSNLDERAQRLLLQRTGVHRRVKLDEGFFVGLTNAVLVDSSGTEAGGSVGLLIEGHRVFTVHEGPVATIETIRARIATGESPDTAFDLLAHMVVAHADQLEDLIAEVAAETEDLEDRVLAEGDDPPLAAVAALRDKAFRIRRPLVSERNLLSVVAADRSLRIDKETTVALSAASALVGSYLESLEDTRERLQLLHQRMEGQLAAAMNRVTYNLTVVATVFLPLTFLTGLLGMNVAGMPEAHDPMGFWVVCLVLGVIAVGSWVFLRWRQWV